ncbi:MAG: LysE family transporter [Candidatus Heimdallarchaeota archaeon]|nr:LysE family transporter [Candidatus Heimdallarchaeota archaeon]
MEVIHALQLAGLGFTLAAPLGPVNVEMLKHTLSGKNGWKMGVITGFGASSADFMIALTILNIGARVMERYFSLLPVQIFLFLANIFILSYIGFMSLKSEIYLEDNFVENVETHLPKQYRFGLLLVLSSPWSYGWWISFGPIMLNSGIPLSSFSEILLATMFFILGILSWVALFNIALKVSHSFASPRVLGWITRISALLLIGFAIKILIDLIILLMNLT